MSRKWTMFEDGPLKPGRGLIYVTLNYRGELILGRTAVEALGNAEAVMVGLDTNADTIGLMPAHKLEPSAFPLTPKGACGHRVVRLKPFCNRWDIRIDGTVRFLTPRIEDGVLTLDLRKLVKAERTKRKGSGAKPRG